MHKHAEIPLFVEIKSGAIETVPLIVEDLKVESAVMLSGRTSFEIAGKVVKEKTKLKEIHILKNPKDEVRRLIAKLSYGDVDCVIAVGGGRIIDSGKILASELNVPLDGEAFSIFTRPPSAVVADTSIISRCPIRLIRAGFGDLISNVTAVKDWKLAKEIDPSWE